MVPMLELAVWSCAPGVAVTSTTTLTWPTSIAALMRSRVHVGKDEPPGGFRYGPQSGIGFRVGDFDVRTGYGRSLLVGNLARDCAGCR